MGKHLEGPNETQETLFAFIVDYVCKNGYQPRQEEMAEVIGDVSPNAVTWHLDVLERFKWIKTPGSGGARNIRLNNVSFVPVIDEEFKKYWRQ